MTTKQFLCGCAWLAFAGTASLAQTPAPAAPTAKAPGALRDMVVLVIRHAEKPTNGMELTPAGVARANAYTNYFKNFTIDSKPLHLDAIFAAADSKNSQRPRLTTEPLSKSLGLPLDLRFKAASPGELADELRAKPHGKQVLICWHHGDIPALLQALDADPAKLLPGGKWPDAVFSWMIQLRYDKDGHLIPAETRCISEDLMPGDAALANATSTKKDKAPKAAN
jgi:hypothetical protein